MIFLTPSKMSLMKECELCFYLEAHKIAPRPRGIFSSVPNAIDSALKKHYDSHRASETVPSEIKDLLQGSLYPNQEEITAFRHWNNRLKVVTGEITLRGAIDDLWVEPDGKISVLDYKTKGSFPEDWYGRKYYQEQMDLLSLMLENGGFEMSGNAYLAYYYYNGSVPVMFDTTIITMTGDPKRGMSLIEKAKEILFTDAPLPSSDCEYCKYVGKRKLSAM